MMNDIAEKVGEAGQVASKPAEDLLGQIIGYLKRLSPGIYCSKGLSLDIPADTHTDTTKRHRYLHVRGTNDDLRAILSSLANVSLSELQQNVPLAIGCAELSKVDGYFDLFVRNRPGRYDVLVRINLNTKSDNGSHH